MKKNSQLVKKALVATLCGLSMWLIGAFIIVTEVESKNNIDDGLALDSAVLRIDQMLDTVISSMTKAAELFNGVCNVTGPALSQLATLTPYSRSFSVVDNQTIVCTSASGNTDLPVENYFQKGKSLSLSYGPIPLKVTMTVNLKRAYGQYELIASIPTFYFNNDLAGRSQAEKFYIKIGSEYLDSQGKVSARLPQQNAADSREKTAQSTRYDYSVIYHILDQRSFLQQLLSEMTLFLLFLCAGPAISFGIWRVIGKPKSLRTKFEMAIEKGEIQPYFQPQMSTQTGELVGCEVLARWISPDDGIIPPNQFIPLSEESGLIVPMTRQLMAQVKRWLLPLQSSLPDGFHVSINFSSQHILSGEIIDDCRQFLKDFKANKVRLVVEITESELLNDNTQINETFTQLQELGILIAIDDFGTGYSNLSYLEDYTLDILKIDRKFINRITPENAHVHLIASIIDISNKMAMKTVVEGVETEMQIEIMKTLNPSWLQGFYYGKPVTGKEFYSRWLKRPNGPA